MGVNGYGEKACLIFAILLITFSLSACAEIISRENIEIEATVVDVNYRSSWLQPVFNGKTYTYISHPAEYITYLKYDGILFRIEGEEIYDYCKENIGKVAICDMQINYFDDGSITRTITNLKGFKE